jgi:hypothetical protein
MLLAWHCNPPRLLAAHQQLYLQFRNLGLQGCQRLDHPLALRSAELAAIYASPGLAPTR